MRICICGGGHLGHVCCGILASHNDVTINILSRNPDNWNKTVKVVDVYSRIYIGNINLITSDPQKAVQDVDIVLLCLPGYAIEPTLRKLQPYLKSNQIVGSIVSSTGFFFNAHVILGEDAHLFGFQRTPFIARIQEYGSSARLLGYKKELKIAVENIENKESFSKIIERLFMTPTKLLNNYYEASLTNSNPILHTGRLYSMWKDWDGEIYDRNIYFYAEWTYEASKIIIEMDNEFMLLLDKLDINNVPSLLTYYEVADAYALTNKISSIPAFQSILAPMQQVEEGWIPDFTSRYFTEDFPYGLKYIWELAVRYNINMPMIESVLAWGERVIGEK